MNFVFKIFKLSQMHQTVFCKKFVIFWGIFLSFFLNLKPPSLQAEPLTGDGKIKIFNYHLNEFLEIEFKKNGQWIQEAIPKIQHLLRSRDDASTTQIDLTLIDWLDALQDHFEADTIEIISGYRRKELNDKLLKEGHSVSPVSLHTQGKALDIHIDEIREETLRDYLLSLKLGGVGYYQSLDFVHLDRGPFRTWQELGERKLVGVLNPKAHLQLTSNANDYLPQSTLEFKWSDSQNLPQSLRLEVFFRGQWIKKAFFKNPQTQNWKLLSRNELFWDKNKKIQFGKYRWIFKSEGSEEENSSNEFYLKRL